ncbi:MAG: hypothetical protein KAJ51_13880, partial [Thermoplasmata archaeon]|nr:hypothetical protein [Thermoplasmata archaeon]
RYNIRYANSANGGKTWGNFKMVTTGTGSSELHRAPSIVVDSKDTVHISWFGSSSSNTAKYNIYYVNRTSTGTWGTRSMVTEDTTDMYHQYPAIAVDTSDDVHVTWSGQTSSAAIHNIQYRKFDSSTDTWSSIEMLTSSSTNNNYNPSIAINMNELSEWYRKNVNAKDSVHITWHAEPSPTQIKHIKWDANTNSWGIVEDITANGNNNFNPTVGVDMRGDVYIVWSKDDNPAINMSAYDGSGWLSEFTLSGDMHKAAHPSIMYGGGNSIIARGVAMVLTGDENNTGCKVYLSTSSDFNLTDIGPWKGIPRFKHLYRDDKPSATMQDITNLRIRVRDDDLVIGEYVIPILVKNVWPTLEKGELNLVLSDDESMLYTPEIKFIDPGTGPAETWSYWLDVDDSETMTEYDLTGTVTTTTVINDVTYGILPPIKTPF